MINYRIIQENEEFKIYETQTEQFIESFNTMSTAKKRVKHFNLGGGFDGWTPSFILIDVKHIK